MNDDTKTQKGQAMNRDFDKDQATNRDFGKPQGVGSRGELDTDTTDINDQADLVDDENEGEGNRSAARRYNESTEKYARSGNVQEKAREAEEALDTDEAPELREAEQIGKQGPEKMISRR